MSVPKEIFAVLAATAIALGSSAASGDENKRHIEFKPIEGEERIAFATKFFFKRFPEEVNWSFRGRRNEGGWARIVREQTYFAEVALADGGEPQLVLMVDNPNWCDSLGCLGTIFRKTVAGYELICIAPLPGADNPPAEILDRVENGFHPIKTQTRIIEWNARQDSDSGTLCSAESPEP